MATIVGPARPMAREERFFLTMAIVMSAVIVAGFSLNLALGRSSFGLPLVYHLHAFAFFGWVTLYLLQNALVATGSVALHRRLGWLAVAWVPMMVVLGLLVIRASAQTHGGPPFFALNEFLIANPMGLLCFAALATAAIVKRRQTAWHRRLIYCAMAILTGPGLGRLLPTPLFIPWAWWIVGILAPSIFPLIGMLADRRRSGRVHPAWYWGLGAFLATQLIAQAVAFSPVGLAITHAIVDGTPGGQRDFAPHFP